MTKQEYILCAAIKRKTPIDVKGKNYKTNTLEDDDIYSIEIGRRHNDILARFGKDVLCLTQQGFYTSWGRFVSREEALQIAKECKGATQANWTLGGPIINPIPNTFCGLEERAENVKNEKNGISWYLSFKNPNECKQNCIENREVKKLEDKKE